MILVLSSPVERLVSDWVWSRRLQVLERKLSSPTSASQALKLRRNCARKDSGVTLQGIKLAQ